MTHAFFKSLLFLAAGVVIQALDEEHNIFKMGGLWRKMPLPFVAFLIGSLSLSALPLVTAGFYSKDLILYETFASSRGGALLWSCGMVGAVLTALYSFRLVFMVFFGRCKREPQRKAGFAMGLPLVVLAFFAIFAGAIELPQNIYGVTLLSGWLGLVLPSAPLRLGAPSLGALQIASGVASVAGIFLAWVLYRRKTVVVRLLAVVPPWRQIRRFWQAGWGFDWLYDRLFVRPFVYLARINRRDFIDGFYGAIGEASKLAGAGLSFTQNGKVGWYVVFLAVGAVALVAILVLL
jgi:NADH-quinone oxidoreductase subunit L